MRFFSFLKDLVVVVVEKATFQTIQYLQKKQIFLIPKIAYSYQNVNVGLITISGSIDRYKVDLITISNF